MMETHRRSFRDAGGREITVSAWTIRGNRPGPVMAVVAGQHGMEHSGCCLLPEFAGEMAAGDFAGTLHIIPCANPAALEMDYEFYPEQEDLSKIKDYFYSRFRHYYCPWNLGRENAMTQYNMNRLWNRPGAYGIAGEITRWLWADFCSAANVTVDLHCHQARKPLVFNSFEKNNLFAAALGAKCVAMCDPNPEEYLRGNLSWQASLGRNAYAVCLEFSVQHALGEHEYEFGKEALRNVMRVARMRPEAASVAEKVWKTPYRDPGAARLHRVAHTGHIRYFKELYDEVSAGDKLFEVRDIQTLDVLEESFAARPGIMAGIAYPPVVKPEMMVCHVAEVELLAEPGKTLDKMLEGWYLQ